LLVTFNNFVNPDKFALALAAQIIMWVLIGGVGTLIGPMLGSLALLMLNNWMGTQNFAGWLNTYLVFGAIIIFFVLAVPQGIQPTAQLLALRFLPWTRPPPDDEQAAARARESAGND
jgi:branched-chain amino acid transport system permease protein